MIKIAFILIVSLLNAISITFVAAALKISSNEAKKEKERQGDIIE